LSKTLLQWDTNLAMQGQRFSNDTLSVDLEGNCVDVKMSGLIAQLGDCSAMVGHVNNVVLEGSPPHVPTSNQLENKIIIHDNKLAITENHENSGRGRNGASLLFSGKRRIDKESKRDTSERVEEGCAPNSGNHKETCFAPISKVSLDPNLFKG